MSKTLKQEKIAVLLGGTSAEREVSLNSGTAVLNALRKQGYDAHPIDPKEFPVATLKEQGFDRVFNILHGRGGEDGTMQGLLEQIGIPYTGCGVMASALTMDKMRTKMLWKAFGLPVAEMEIVTVENRATLNPEVVVKKLGLPLMVKPSLEGSSVGLTKVKTMDELESAVDFALKFDRTVLIEEWLAGDEFTVPVLDNEVLPSIKIVPEGEFYDYDAKYISDNTQYFCPAGLSDAREQELRRLVKQAYDVVGCRGWSRIDVMADAAYVVVEDITLAGAAVDGFLVGDEEDVMPLGLKDVVVKFLEFAFACLVDAEECVDEFARLEAIAQDGCVSVVHHRVVLPVAGGAHAAPCGVGVELTRGDVLDLEVLGGVLGQSLGACA